MIDNLGDRMKSYYENRSKTFLTRRTPVIIRLDGKAFHTFTKGFNKPFDVVLEVMEQLGFEELEHEINGWDLDYWATFTKGNLTYSVDGSHYYGNCKVEKVYDD